MNAWQKRFSPALLMAALLAGCGGGGGASVQVPTFPLLSAVKAVNANGFTATFTAAITVINPATGALVTCRANGNSSTSAATTAATFEGQPALSATGTVTVNVLASADCNAATTTETIIGYFDSNYIDLGYSMVGGEYAVFQAPPVVPVSVKVGDTAIVGTEDIYTNSTKTTSNGTEVHSFIVEAETFSTAIVNNISKTIDTIGNVTSTTQARWRITEAGALTPISVDVLYANGDSLNIQFD